MPSHLHESASRNASESGSQSGAAASRSSSRSGAEWAENGTEDDTCDAVYGDTAAHERARRYSRAHQWLTLADMLWSTLLCVFALSTGLSARLRERAERIAPRRLGPAMPYALAATALAALASLPLTYYNAFVLEHRYGLSNQSRRNAFVLEHRYGLSNQSRRAWFGEQLKQVGVGTALGLPIAQAVYWIMRRYPRRWWAILSALTIPFTVLLSQLAPVLILPLFNKYEPLHDRALAERIKRLAATQGVRVADVVQMDMSKQTKKANAFFMGIGRTKRIVLGDTLLAEFTPDEIEVVLAHELGHQVHHDLWKGIGAGALTTLATSYGVHRLARPLIAQADPHWGLDRERGAADVAALPLLVLLLDALSLIIAPLRNAWTRRRVEHAADRYALDLTRNPVAFVGAMEKLGRMNLADPAPPAVVKHLLYSHPPLHERIAFGRSYIQDDAQSD